MKETIAQEENAIDKPLIAPSVDAGVIKIERIRLGIRLNTTKGAEPNQIGKPSLIALLGLFIFNKIFTIGNAQMIKLTRIM